MVAANAGLSTLSPLAYNIVILMDLPGRGALCKSCIRRQYELAAGMRELLSIGGQVR